MATIAAPLLSSNLRNYAATLVVVESSSSSSPMDMELGPPMVDDGQETKRKMERARKIREFIDDESDSDSDFCSSNNSPNPNPMPMPMKKRRRRAPETSALASPAPEELPEDLILDILLRLPAKSLAAFKSVCRSWYNLISDPSFYNTHPVFPSHDKVILDLKHPDVLKFFNPASPVIDVIGSCNGLLCLLKENQNLTPVLFNPATRESRQLPPLADPLLFIRSIKPRTGITNADHEQNRPPITVVPANTNYGFGFDPISQDYIVVAIRCFRNSNSRVDPYFYPSQLFIYTLRTNSWQRLPDTPCLTDCLWTAQKSRATEITKSGILVANALHWLSSFCGVHDSDYWSFVAAFDISRRKFRQIPLPDYDRRHKLVQLSEIDGHLCFLSYYGLGMKVWRLGGDGSSNIYSWTLMFNVPGDMVPSIRHYVPLATSSGGRHLLLHNRYGTSRRQGILVYNLVNKSCGSETKFGLPARLVQSLVPLIKHPKN